MDTPKANRKRRLISGLLALTLLASCLPAGLVAPAHAVTLTKLISADLQIENGAFTATFILPDKGTPGAAVSDFGFVLAPDVAKTLKGYTPSAKYHNESDTTFTELGSAADLAGPFTGNEINQSSDMFVAKVQSDFDPAVVFDGNGDITIKGELADHFTDIDTLLGKIKNKGYVDAAGNVIDDDATSIDLFAALWYNDTYIGADTAAWTPSPADDVELTVESPYTAEYLSFGIWSGNRTWGKIKATGDIKIIAEKTVLEQQVKDAYLYKNIDHIIKEKEASTTGSTTLRDGGTALVGLAGDDFDSCFDVGSYTGVTGNIIITYQAAAGGPEKTVNVPVIITVENTSRVSGPSELLFHGEISWDDDGNAAIDWGNDKNKDLTLVGELGGADDAEILIVRSSGNTYLAPYELSNSYDWDCDSLAYDTDGSKTVPKNVAMGSGTDFLIAPPTAQTIGKDADGNNITEITDYKTSLAVHYMGDKASVGGVLYIDLVARLTPKAAASTDKVTFDANNGRWSNGDTARAAALSRDGTAAFPDSAPVRTYYTFAGWYTAAENGDEVTASSAFANGDTIYAHWQAKEIAFSDVAYSGKAGATSLTRTGGGFAAAGDHARSDFTYKIGNAELTGEGLTDMNSNLTIYLENNEVQVKAADDTGAKGSVTWTVTAISNQTGAAKDAKFVVTVPPKIESATATNVVANQDAKLGSIVLSDQMKISVDGDTDNLARTANHVGDVTILGWALGSVRAHDETGAYPELSGTGATVGIPVNARDGDYLWVQLKGDGVNIDDTAEWYCLDEVGNAAAELKVTPLYKTGASTYTEAVPASLEGTVSHTAPSAHTKNETTTVATSYDKTDLKFLGWSLESDGATVTTDGAREILTLPSVTPSGGSASVAMKVVDGVPVETIVYAIYEVVPTYSFTVVCGAGVSGVEVKRTRGMTTASLGGAGTHAGVRGDDVITVSITGLTEGYTYKSANAFAVSGTTASCSTTANSGTAFVCGITGDGAVITAMTDPAPANLTIEQTRAGAGAYDAATKTFRHETDLTATVTNSGGAVATISSVALDSASTKYFDVTNHTGSVAARDGASTLTITPKANVTLTDAIYPITVTATYDGDKTATTTVTYVVTRSDRFTGTVTVKKDGAACSAATATIADVAGERDGNVTTFINLTKGNKYTVTIDVDGATTTTTDRYTVSLSDSDPNITVDLYTVTVELAEEDASANALSNGGSIALKVDSDVSQAVASADLTSKIARKTVPAGTVVSVDVDLSGAKVGYTFERYGVTRNGTATADVFTRARTFSVDGRYVLTAHLKPSADPAVVTYLDNYTSIANRDETRSPYVDVPGPDISTVGASYTVSSHKPSIPGFKFVKWNTRSDGSGTDHAPGDPITLDGMSPAFNGAAANGRELQLYAIWEDAAIALTVPADTQTGVYGTDFTGAAITASSVDPEGDPVDLKFSQSGLPGGLGIEESSGRIYGKPYQVSGTATSGGVTALTPIEAAITVELAEDYHDAAHKISVTAENAYRVSVDKALPVVTKVEIDGAAPGAALNTADYTVSVIGPRLTAGAGTANDPTDDAWAVYEDAIHYRVASGGTENSQTAGVGTIIGFASDADGAADRFNSSGKTAVTVTFAPRARGTGENGTGSFDAAVGHKQDAVWRSNTGTGVCSINEVYGLKVEDVNWSIVTHEKYTSSAAGGSGAVTAGSGSAADDVASKEFTLTNTGDQTTGALSYTWSSTEDGKTSAWFQFVETPVSTLPAASGGNTTKIKVALKTGASRRDTAYTDTLTIQDTVNGSTVQITFSLVVKEALTYDATIRVDKQAVSDDAKVEKVSTPGGTTIQLVPSDATSHITVTLLGDVNGTNGWVSADGAYKATLVAGETYNVVVKNTGGGDYTVGAITSAVPSKTITLYELRLGTISDAVTPAALALTDTEGDQSGAGWYVDGQYASLSSFTAGTVDATDYVFANQWKTGSVSGAYAADTHTTSSFLTKVDGAKEYSAVYSVKDPAKVYLTYFDNVAGGTILVPRIDEQPLDSTGTFTVSSAAPARSGYIFQGWAKSGDLAETGDDANDKAMKADAALIQTSDNSTLATSDSYDLYAIWKKGELKRGDDPVSTGNPWSLTDQTGTYGVPFTYALPQLTTTDGAAVTYQLDSGSTLPGGLTLNETTGVISGTPYEVVTEKEIKVIATHSVWNAGGAAVSTNAVFKVTVGKYQLYLSNTSVTNVVAGKATSTGTYTATVVPAPYYGKVDGKAGWTTFTEDVGLPPAAGQKGTLSITNSDTVSRFTDEAVDVALRYAPSTSTADTDKDSADAPCSAIYLPATATVKASGSSTYTMTVTEEPSAGDNRRGNTGVNITMVGPKADGETAGFVADVGYTVNAATAVASADGSTGGTRPVDLIQAQLFTLTNTGNQATGKLTCRFSHTGTTDGKYFQLGAAADETLIWETGLAAAGAEGGASGTFTVAPRACTPALGPGTYTETLTITNQNSFTVSVTLSLTVNKANVPVKVVTYLWDEANYNAYYTNYNNGTATEDEKAAVATKVKHDLYDGDVVLIDTDPNAIENRTIAVATADAANGEYTASIDYDASYYIQVNGCTVTDKRTGMPAVLDRSNADVGVYLYKVTTDVASGSSAPAGTVKNSVDQTLKTAAAYVVHGETAKLIAGDPATGSTFREWKDTSADARVSTSSVYTTPALTSPASYTAVFEADAAKYALTFVGAGKTSGDPPAQETHVSGDTFSLAGPNTMEKPGCAFAGWAETETETDGEPILKAGSAYVMPAADTRLYARWTAVGGEFYLPDTTITAYYGEALPGTDTLAMAVGLTDAGAYSFGDDVSSPAWWDPALAIHSGDRTITGAPTIWDSVGTAPYEAAITRGVQVTDSANGNTAAATLTIHVEKARTKAAMVPAVAGDKAFYPGDAFTLADLKQEDGRIKAVVNALRHDDTDGTKTLATDIAGDWSIVSGETIGTDSPHIVQLKFEPADPGFLSTTVDLAIDVTRKIITRVDLSIAFPAGGAAPDKTGAVVKVTEKAGSPGIDTTDLSKYVALLEAKDSETISWTGGINAAGGVEVFDVTQYIYVFATIEARGDWVFDDKDTFRGCFQNSADATGADLVTAEVMSWGSKQILLMGIFDREDRLISAPINVNTTAPVVGGGATSWSVSAADVNKYYVDTAAAGCTYTCKDGEENKTVHVVTHWEDREDTPVTDSAPFVSRAEKDQALYDAVVVVRAHDGYEFDPDVFGDPANTGLATIATIGDSEPSEGPRLSAVQVSLSDDNKILVARYSGFQAAEIATAGVKIAGAPGVYYARTGDDAAHFDTNATGHGSATVDGAAVCVPFAFNSADVQVYPIYADGTVGAAALTTGYEIGKWDGAAFTPIPPDGFRDGCVVDARERHDVADWDGRALYVKYNSQYYPVPGTLTVKTLRATSISAVNGWSVAADGAFTITSATAAVTFNRGDAVENTRTDLRYAEKGAKYGVHAPAAKNTGGEESPVYAPDYRPSFYFMVDADDGEAGAESITVEGASKTVVELVDGAVVDGGKAIYACYTDVNGNLAAAVVRAGFNVEVVDENGHDKEYGDRLTATPGAGGPDDYTYRWQKWTWNDDTARADRKDANIGDRARGSWTDLDGGSDRDHTPGRTEVGQTIRVVAVDKATGAPASSGSFQVRPRSLNFIVDLMNKSYDGDSHQKLAYESGNFHPTRVLDHDNRYYGGVIDGDAVSISPAGAWNEADDTRPRYLDKDGKPSSAVDSEIAWPAVSEAGTEESVEGVATTVPASRLADYKVSDPAYRLTSQAAQSHRGKLLENGVIHVDISFADLPEVGEAIPAPTGNGNPMGAADLRQTRPGEGTDTAAVSGPSGFQATWYEDVDADFDPTTTARTAATGAFTAGKSYTVVVRVRPVAGSTYRTSYPAGARLEDLPADSTRFYFHFGGDDEYEVALVEKGVSGLKIKKGAPDVYYLWHTIQLEGDSRVLPPTPGDNEDPGSIDGLLNGAYYLQTTGHTKANAEGGDNDPTPGGKGGVGFTLDVTEALQAPVGASGSARAPVQVRLGDAGPFPLDLTTDTVTDTTATGRQYHYSATNPEGWRLVLGDSPTDVRPLGESFQSGTFQYTFMENKEKNISRSTFDGKRVYLQVGETVVPTDLGVLTVKELTADTIEATKNEADKDLRLVYRAGDALQITSQPSNSALTYITGAKVTFSRDAPGDYAVIYPGATCDQNRHTATSCYFQYRRPDAGSGELTYTDLPADATLVPEIHDGALLYICYTDVNGADAIRSEDADHIVREPLGTLKVYDANDLTVYGWSKVPVADENVITSARVLVASPETRAQKDIWAAGSAPYDVIHKGAADEETMWEHWEEVDADGDGTPEAHRWVSVTDPTATFKAGDYYRARLTVEIAPAFQNIYRFTSDTAGCFNGTLAAARTALPATRGDDGEVYIVRGEADPLSAAVETITLAMVFLVSDKRIVTVHVGSALPRSGEAPGSVGIHASWQSVDNDRYTLSDMRWVVDPDDMEAVTTFTEGSTYYLVVTAAPRDGYELSEEAAGYQWVDRDAQFARAEPEAVKTEDGSRRVYFSYRVPGEGETRSISVVPGNAAPPERGRTLDAKGWTSEDFTVEGDVLWYEGAKELTDITDETPKAAGAAKEEAVYTAVITVKPREDVALAPPLVCTFNGAVCATDAYRVNEDGTCTLSCAFPRTGRTTASGGDPVEPERSSGTTRRTDEPEPPAGAAGQPAGTVEPERSSRSASGGAYIQGFEDGTFRPDEAATRATVASMLAGLIGRGPGEGENSVAFADLSGHWAASDIACCVEKGYMSGYEDGSFRPDRPMTRQELTTVVARLAGVKTNQGLPFRDAAEVSDWALDGVYTAYANGWVNGYEDGTFRPLNDVTRAETVKLLNAYLGRSADPDVIRARGGCAVCGDVPETHWAYYEIVAAANDWGG